MKLQKYFDKQLQKYCWRIDLTINHQRIRRGRFTTKAEAQQAITEIQARANRRRYHLADRSVITLGELLARREATPHTHRQGLQALRWFVAFAGAGTPLQDVSRELLLQFRADLARQAARKPSTLQLYCNYVGRHLRAASDHWPDLDWMPPRVPQLRSGFGRSRVLSAAELGRLLQALDGPRLRHESPAAMRRRHLAADVVRFAVLVPARRGELLALTAADVNPDFRTLLIRASKTGTERMLPLTDAALAILRRHWPEKGRLFFALTAKQLLTALQKAALGAQLVYGDNVENGFVFHDLRHLAASILAAAQIDHATTAYLLGHKAGGMTHRYTHPSVDSQRDGLAALERWLLALDGDFLTGAQRRVASYLYK